MPSDCLVLKIEEVDPSVTEVIDNAVFILYDQNEGQYILRGKRNDTPDIKFETYNFSCDSTIDIVDYLSFIIDNNNLLNYRLYNMTDLPLSSDNIYFDKLVEYATGSNELVAYNSERFSKRMLKTRIQILKNVYNTY